VSPKLFSAVPVLIVLLNAPVEKRTKKPSGGAESVKPPTLSFLLLTSKRDVVPIVAWGGQPKHSAQSLAAALLERFCQRLLRASGFQESPLLAGPALAASTASEFCK
jgi:hypothetical protein